MWQIIFSENYTCPDDCTSPTHGTCDTTTGECECAFGYSHSDFIDNCAGIFLQFISKVFIVSFPHPKNNNISIFQNVILHVMMEGALDQINGVTPRLIAMMGKMRTIAAHVRCPFNFQIRIYLKKKKRLK